MEILGGLIFIVGGIVCLYFLFTHTDREFEFFEALSKERTERDLIIFKDHFLTKGYSEKTIDAVIKGTRKHIRLNDFIPKTTDKFKYTYHWNYEIGDQFNTPVMYIAGETFIELGQGNISQSEWDTYEEENGKIDSFNDLFLYVKSVLDTHKPHSFFSSLFARGN